jgi:hypothetical protein
MLVLLFALVFTVYTLSAPPTVNRETSALGRLFRLVVIAGLLSRVAVGVLVD